MGVMSNGNSNTLEFGGIDRAKFDALRLKSAEAGFPLTDRGSDIGEGSGKGVTVQWAYYEGAQKLVLICTKKPFLIPMGSVMGRLRAAIEGA